nr:MAG TPA_asm: hypothetical protein [Caudoviricetes sp.]
MLIVNTKVDIFLFWLIYVFFVVLFYSKCYNDKKAKGVFLWANLNCKYFLID